MSKGAPERPTPSPQQNRRASDLRLDELRERINATDDLAAEHETRLDVMFKHQRLVAQQIADLDTKMDSRFADLEARMPAMLAETARAMVRDPEEWAAALSAAQAGLAKMASHATGSAVMRMFRSATLGVFKFLLLLAVLYYTGGLKAVLAFLTVKGAAP